MQELSIIINNETKTMSSLDIVAMINQHRKNTNDDTVLLHKNFLVKCKEIIGEELSLKFSSVYKDASGKENPCYQLPKRETMLMLMSYSYELQALVYDRWQELENANKGSYMIDDPIKRAEMWIQEQKEKQALALALENKTIELDQSKEWLSIKRVAKHNNIHWKLLDWRALKASGIAHGYAPKKVFDANFGLVNTYHRTTFKMIYPELNLQIKDSK
jgi:phage regulator Rha-like protein